MLSPRKLTASLAVAASLGAVAVVAGPAEPASAVPDTIPLTLKNDSGSGEQVYVYVIGTELASGKQGYADENGTFHAWPAGG
ncbi:beta-1,3-glucanase family protein, partial [Streptomyces sp. Tu 4128]